MIWATVSSQSCFCWLYRASLSLAAKNIISLILVLTIWWCPCVESSLVLLEEGVCYDQCVLLAKLLAFALLHSVLQGQIWLLQVYRYFLLLHSCLLWWRASLVTQLAKILPEMQETWIWSLGWKQPLEKRMTAHSITLEHLQYSGLDNFTDCIVHGVTKSKT